MHLCLLAKTWYVSQIIPPLPVHTQQITTVCNWYIWQGATFQVPATTPTTQRTRWLGTAGHRSEMQNASFKPHVDAPCIRRISNSGMDAEMATDRHPGEPSALKLDLKEDRLSQTLCHRYGVNNPPGNIESLKIFNKQRVMATVESRTPDLRVIQKHPSIPWGRVWCNLHHAPISDCLKSTWYNVIHEIIPTNER